MQETIFAYSGGFSTRLLNCNLSKACCWGAGFIGCDFSGSDFSGAYFEGAYLEDIKVNHKTRFNLELKMSWKNRSMPPDQAPDILRAIRVAYEKAEIWGYSDVFQYQEKVAQRKHILWPRLVEEKGFRQLFAWAGSLFSAMFSGHSTRPFRVIIVAFLIAVAFSGLYFLLGTPGQQQSGFTAVLESLYFSFTTFATLGYGDISYGANHPYLRLLSTIEAWVGAIFISMFVVVLSRKVFR